MDLANAITQCRESRIGSRNTPEDGQGFAKLLFQCKSYCRKSYCSGTSCSLLLEDDGANLDLIGKSSLVNSLLNIPNLAHKVCMRYAAYSVP